MRAFLLAAVFLLICSNVFAADLTLKIFDIETRKETTGILYRVTIQGYSNVTNVNMVTNNSACSVSFQNDNAGALLFYQHIKSILKKKHVIVCAGKVVGKSQTNIRVNTSESIPNTYYSIAEN
ncbi:MAG: hypothetical protein RBT37_08860 [Dissulfurispiraceae bacterium]|jgi:preprotein translocase subunit SecD|nr:hypothetical protein [Dissulfurispiraceae bacterium]